MLDFYELEYDGYHYNVSNLMLSQEGFESSGHTIGYTISVYTTDPSPS